MEVVPVHTSHTDAPGKVVPGDRGCEVMAGLPVDLALTLAGVGIDVHQDDEPLEQALRAAIGERRGYLGELAIGAQGWELELLYPVRETFGGRTRVQAFAWCLVYLLGETGELGIGGFSA